MHGNDLQNASHFGDAAIHICLIGGIFDKPQEYRDKARFTPETILETALRQQNGVEVTTLGHQQPIPEQSFDVIHTHHLGYGALKASLTLSRARVFTSHDGFTLSGRKQPLLNRLATRFVMNRSQAVIALSKREADFNAARYGVSPERTAVIANGIDATNFEFSPRSAPSDGIWNLLCVGQLIPQKNVHLLLRALSKVTFKWRLQLVFHVEAERQNLEALARELQIADRCRFVGALPPEQLAHEHRRCHAMIHASAAEALPSVISEAMLCGTPVVATNVGGIKEQLAGLGVLIQPNSVEELIAGLERLVHDYDWHMTQAPAMRKHALQQFSIEGMVEKHLNLYRKLLEQPRAHVGGPLDAALLHTVNWLCDRRLKSSKPR